MIKAGTALYFSIFGFVSMFIRDYRPRKPTSLEIAPSIHVFENGTARFDELLQRQDKKAFQEILDNTDFKRKKILDRPSILNLFQKCVTCEIDPRGTSYTVNHFLVDMHHVIEDRRVMKKIILPQMTQYLLSKNENATVLNIGINNYNVWIEEWFNFFQMEYITVEQDEAQDRFGSDNHKHDIDEVADESLSLLIAFGIWNYGTVKSQETMLLEKFKKKLKKDGILMVYFNDHYQPIDYKAAQMQLLNSSYFPKNPFDITSGTFEIYIKTN